MVAPFCIISCKINVRGVRACGVALNNCLRRGRLIPGGQCWINHGDDGARARAPRPWGPRAEHIFLRQRELVVGCTAPHGTCLS